MSSLPMNIFVRGLTNDQMQDFAESARWVEKILFYCKISCGRKNGIFEDIFFAPKDADEVGSDDKDAFSNNDVIDLTSRRRATGKRRIDFSSRSVQPKNTTGVTALLKTEIFKFNSKHPVQNNIKAATIETTVASIIELAWRQMRKKLTQRSHQKVQEVAREMGARQKRQRRGKSQRRRGRKLKISRTCCWQCPAGSFLWIRES